MQIEEIKELRKYYQTLPVDGNGVSQEIMYPSPKVRNDVLKLLSTIEGLKEEVTRLTSDVAYWHETWEQERDLAKGQKEHLRQQVETYRTALERITSSLQGPFLATTGEGHAECFNIARKALEGSHETP